MRVKLVTIQVLLAVFGAVAAAWYAVASIQVSGIVSTNWTAEDVIRQRCPLHLVKPEWIKGSDQGDILFSWVITETWARLAAVFVFWVIIVSLLVWRTLRRRQYEEMA